MKLKIARTISKKYLESLRTVLEKGTIENIFDFAYTLGQQHQIEYMLHETKKFIDGFAHPKDCEKCNPPTI